MKNILAHKEHVSRMLAAYKKFINVSGGKVWKQNAQFIRHLETVFLLDSGIEYPQCEKLPTATLYQRANDMVKMLTDYYNEEKYSEFEVDYLMIFFATILQSENISLMRRGDGIILVREMPFGDGIIEFDLPLNTSCMDIFTIGETDPDHYMAGFVDMMLNIYNTDNDPFLENYWRVKGILSLSMTNDMDIEHIKQIYDNMLYGDGPFSEIHKVYRMLEPYIYCIQTSDTGQTISNPFGKGRMLDRMAIEVSDDRMDARELIAVLIYLMSDSPHDFRGTTEVRYTPDIDGWSIIADGDYRVEDGNLIYTTEYVEIQFLDDLVNSPDIKGILEELALHGTIDKRGDGYVITRY